MTKEELIQLLKEYKENVSKLQLRKREVGKLIIKLHRLEKQNDNIETTISSAYGNNTSIRSKNKISDKIGDAVSKSIDNREAEKEFLKSKIKEFNNTIEILEEKVAEAEIRINSLYYKEREILTAYYVENRTAEDISKNLYFKLYDRTCSQQNVYRIIERATDRLLKL